MDDLSETGPDVDVIIERALAEDLASGDVTSRSIVPTTLTRRARMVAKAPLVMAGGAIVERVFARIDPQIEVSRAVLDGAQVAPGAVLARLRGPARGLLAGERTALNLLQRMCGVATLTRSFVDALAGAPCRVVDTRKTMPGLRALDRYAVRCGGGTNHRNDLGAAVLIKENHVRCAGGVAAAITAAREHAPHTMKIECEVQTLAELEEALGAGADIVMLDNMSDDEVRAAVKMTRETCGSRVLLEVSGGVELARVGRLAALGIDVISVGRLTHSAPASDISMLFELDGAVV
ncbi:MAG: carboxylating nicotinate-nucleotide diphosphorylase [Myxococcales bacterium]|nr:carboxylating nicotinate-nucleotide diphosphorylase [Myxococcales bacterium]